MRRAALCAVLLLCLLGVATSSVLAGPQSRPVCGACGEALEESADEQGVPLTVTNSTATVRIHQNGSATWVVTNRLTESSAANLTAESGRVDRVSRTAATDGWGLPAAADDSDVQFQSAALDGQTLRIRFRDRNASERHLGVTVVDYLHTGGRGGSRYLNVDRFTVIGPEGTVVANNLTAAVEAGYSSADAVPQVTGRNVVWTDSLPTDVYIAFAGPGTPDRNVGAALTLASLPIWLDNVLAFVLPAVVVYGLLLKGVAVTLRRAATTTIAPRTIAASLTGLGLGGLVLAALLRATGGPAWFAGGCVVYAICGGVGLRYPSALRSVRGTLLVAGTVALALGGMILGLSLATGWPERTARAMVDWAVIHAPLSGAPAFGLAVAQADARRDGRLLVRAYLGALGTVALAGMALVPFDTRLWILVLVPSLGAALLTAVFSVPLAILAARQWVESTGEAG